jgi:hypothetical protein
MSAAAEFLPEVTIQKPDVMSKDVECCVVPGGTPERHFPVWRFVLREIAKRPASATLLLALTSNRASNVGDLVAESLSKFLGNCWESFGYGSRGF